MARDPVGAIAERQAPSPARAARGSPINTADPGQRSSRQWQDVVGRGLGGEPRRPGAHRLGHLRGDRRGLLARNGGLPCPARSGGLRPRVPGGGLPIDRSLLVSLTAEIGALEDRLTLVIDGYEVVSGAVADALDFLLR